VARRRPRREGTPEEGGRAGHRDPYERAYFTSNTYYDRVLDRAFFLVPAQAYVAQFLATFKEFPPRAEPSSFTISAAVEKMKKAMESAGG
jgi:arylsulfatase